MDQPRCPATTGIGPATEQVHGPGEPCRCMLIAVHIANRAYDHRCSCGKTWSSGPTVAEQTEALNRASRPRR